MIPKWHLPDENGFFDNPVGRERDRLTEEGMTRVIQFMSNDTQETMENLLRELFPDVEKWAVLRVSVDYLSNCYQLSFYLPLYS